MKEIIKTKINLKGKSNINDVNLFMLFWEYSIKILIKIIINIFWIMKYDLSLWKIIIKDEKAKEAASTVHKFEDKRDLAHLEQRLSSFVNDTHNHNHTPSLHRAKTSSVLNSYPTQLPPLPQAAKP